MQNQCQDNFSTTFTTYGEMQLYRDQFEEVCNLIVEAASFQGAAFFYKKFWWMQ